MKWIGQHIWDFISRFRSDVYLEEISNTSTDVDKFLVAESDGKIGYRTGAEVLSDIGASAESSDLEISNASDNRVVTSSGGTDLNAEANFTYDGNNMSLTAITSTFTHGTSSQIIIKNNGANASGGILDLINERGTGVDGDTTGLIRFYGDDNGGNTTLTTEMTGKISETNDGDEFGLFQIKSLSGGQQLRNALELSSDTGDDKVNVSLGYGASSVTTIAGTLTMGSTAFVNNSGVVQVATQGTINHDSLANFVANEHIDWTGDVSASSVVHTNNITDLHGAGVDGSANQILTDDGDGTITSEANFTFDGQDLMITSAADAKPVVEIKSTTNSNKGSEIKFTSDKGAVGADGDYIGNITFYGDNVAQEQTMFSSIQSRVVTAADTDEAGRLLLRVATSDGSLSTVTTGLDLFGHATTNDVDATIGSGTTSDVTVAGNLTVTNKATIPSRKFTVTSDTHFEYQGDVLYGHGSGATTQGYLYTLKHDGTWSAADADVEALSTGMLAISLGDDPDVDGMLIRGMITFDSDMGTLADKLYVSTTSGGITNTAPSASGDFVRVIGYVLDSTDGQIWFDPDNSWVEIA